MKLEQQQELMARLSIMQKLSLAEAMEILNVSESTIRRIFAKMEKEGVAIRTHGGIQSASGAMTRYSFEYGTKTNIEKKTAIAREACKLLKNGDVIFCDTGTTTQCFCAELVCRIKREGLNVKLYTNSLANLELLSPYMPVTLIGGEYRPNRKDFCGYLTDQALTGLYFSKSFVGADGCVHGRQFTTTDFDTARMNQIAMRNTDQNIMLVDSSKFSVSAHVGDNAAHHCHRHRHPPGDARAAQKLARPGDLRRRIQAVCGRNINVYLPPKGTEEKKGISL